ncbi:MAG: SDR family NAD(P)-dependent oxidoreductase, partial [Acidimicrobiia bacterium]|nr:SDR family NAD(P)-dependent oxidoreductase [Acidimicrobiia bacterium]
GGRPPNLLICNSGLTESGYSFGRALRPVEDESVAMRRARVRQHFIDSLDESRLVLNTKIDGFMGTTHLWAGEAVYHQSHLRIVYVSSRQAVDPGPAVPGYAISNWAVLQLPRVLEVNLGRASEYVSAMSVLFPFVRTGMTDEYADNEKVFGRWQPRMLETHECAQAFAQLMTRSNEEINKGMYELMVDRVDTGDDIAVTWREVKFNIEEAPLGWSNDQPLIY